MLSIIVGSSALICLTDEGRFFLETGRIFTRTRLHVLYVKSVMDVSWRGGGTSWNGGGRRGARPEQAQSLH